MVWYAPVRPIMRVPLTTAVLLVATSVAIAGGPGSEERLFYVGRCGSSGPKCGWSCADSKTTCDNGQTCKVQSTTGFTGQVIVALNDATCGSQDGAVVTVIVRGKKPDGTRFTVAGGPFDLCGGTSGCSSFRCPDQELPRATVFQCSTSGDTSELLPPFEGWLHTSDFPASIAQQIKDQFPGVTGTPIIVGVKDKSLPSDNHSNFDDPLPTVKRFCVKVAFAQ